MKKRGVDPSIDRFSQECQDNVRIATYYRTPILMEEMYNLGFSRDRTHEAIAKAFFLQYWSGDQRDQMDSLIFNKMIRVFYPMNSHITTGANDLGRETEFQAAKLFAGSYTQPERPLPVTIVNFGDSGPFTDGGMHAWQHAIEAAERGYPMPMIFLCHSNNSSISSRLSVGWGDDPAAAVKRIEDRFKMWGPVLGEGFTTKAEDVPGGMLAMRDAVDQVMQSGKPTYVISSFNKVILEVRVCKILFSIFDL